MVSGPLPDAEVRAIIAAVPVSVYGPPAPRRAFAPAYSGLLARLNREGTANAPARVAFFSITPPGGCVKEWSVSKVGP